MRWKHLQEVNKANVTRVYGNMAKECPYLIRMIYAEREHEGRKVAGEIKVVDDPYIV